MAGIQNENENGFNVDNYIKEKVLITKLEDLWQKEAMFWHQRSRVNWLKMGDKNTRFFHLSTVHRRQRNQVAKLKDENGIWQVDKEYIAGIIKGHFEKLYSPPPTRDTEAIISLVDTVVSSEMNTALTKPVTREEVKAATFQMGALKAPGSDGFPGLFYQKYWHVVGEDVFNAARNFFEGGYLLKEMNHTNVTLIPKVTNPESMGQFRPISLCRSNYKIFSKIMANRLQPFIHNIITEQQSAFIPGRQIHDNIIVAHEVFHYLKHKKSGMKRNVAVKLDLNKASFRQNLLGLSY